MNLLDTYKILVKIESEVKPKPVVRFLPDENGLLLRASCYIGKETVFQECLITHRVLEDGTNHTGVINDFIGKTNNTFRHYLEAK